MNDRLPPGSELAGNVDELASYVAVALTGLTIGAAERGGPLPAGGPDAVAKAVVAALNGGTPSEALADLARVVTAGSADPADPRCAGHLHCPPLAIAVAADLVASALNQSLDSWDQAPASTALEGEVITQLARMVGYDPARAGGVITSGGTESNLMGLLLARDHATKPVRVFCSRMAHFSIARNAGFLGLDPQAVVDIDVDESSQLDLDKLAAALDQAGDVSPVVVATAGTTDLGAIDPVDAIADLARERQAWLHVDAAYGGGALFSERMAPLLTGIERADSVSLDLHKLGWQPVPAGVFLTRDRESFAPLTQRAAYLNPADDEEAGYPSLLGQSLRTTRRADAVKIAVTLRALGRSGLGTLVERCHELADYAAVRIAEHDSLELAAKPVLTTVVFRYNGSDTVNAALRRRLLEQGRVVVGRTALGGRTWLKLTLLNPHARTDDIDAVLDAVVAAGAEEER
ncbi:pyridoxal phosphate-dependent decarboxylase family protein [Tenggerimyces flavus]|uniref:Pyridoxal phosphate-dependent decarboxylase family protein n=1 Tax=Tenggerimyces flavus TaxID=1708749 RepID=A0ABV7Y6M5_9ACTN|nr:aminotransferase class V-fold PLP-dependent enzyme [Tenggerimyces flavus]MBM7785116.1 L-2,4-diaminobutyrate decarboxylase [Tenggerimyces flavus]